MQLEAGKKYTDRRGRVYGPMVEVADNLFGENHDDYGWYSDGQRSPGKSVQGDLIAEHVDPAPAESPDDLVIQDRVPARAGIDFGWNVGVKEFATYTPCDRWKWNINEPYTGRMHGSEGNIGRLAVFCRRKDLPPVPAVETWPKWMKISDSQIASFPKEGESTNYYSSGGTSVGWAYDSYAERTWTPITEEQAKKQMADWETGRHPKTRTVVLKEWICWDDGHEDVVLLRWSSADPAVDNGNLSTFDHAAETGNTRTVEVPVT